MIKTPNKIRPVYWGVSDEQPVDVQRQIGLINVINLVGLSFQIPFFIFLFNTGYKEQSYWNLLSAVFHGTSLLLQRFGFTSLARHTFAITFPCLVVFLTFSYGGENSTEMYLYLCFPLIFYIFKSKRTFRIYSIYLTTLLALLYWSRHHNWIKPDIFEWGDIFWYTTFVVSFASFIFLFWTIKRESILSENVQKDEQEAIVKLLQDVKSSDTIKGKFLRIFSHDLRAPFHGLLGVIDLLLEDERPMTLEEARPLLIRLHESSKNTLLLLDNLVDWTKSQQNTLKIVPQVLPLAELVHQTVMLYEQVAHIKNIKLTTKVPENLHVWADLPTFMTILRNLLNNAIKFSHSGGEVIIHTQQDAASATIIVQDFGTGMKPNTLATLFLDGEEASVPGTQGEKGSGLGLTLCKDFVEKNDGRLHVESEWGKGTSFYVKLPRR